MSSCAAETVALEAQTHRWLITPHLPGCWWASPGWSATTHVSSGVKGHLLQHHSAQKHVTLECAQGWERFLLSSHHLQVLRSSSHPKFLLLRLDSSGVRDHRTQKTVSGRKWSRLLSPGSSSRLQKHQATGRRYLRVTKGEVVLYPPTPESLLLSKINGCISLHSSPL